MYPCSIHWLHLPLAIGSTPSSPRSQLLRARCSKTLFVSSAMARLWAPRAPICNRDEIRSKINPALSNQNNSVRLHNIISYDHALPNPYRRAVWPLMVRIIYYYNSMALFFYYSLTFMLSDKLSFCMLQVMCRLQRTSEILRAPEGLTPQSGRLSCCTTLKKGE